MRTFFCAVMLALCFVSASIMAQNLMPERSGAVQNQSDSATSLEQNLGDVSASAIQSAQALNSTNMRVGFVNFRRIMSSIPQLAKLRDDLQREFRAPT